MPISSTRWSNIILKKIPKSEFELRTQIDSASDSVGANFVEGYYSGSTAEYMRFCRYSKRSLAELQERIRRALRKGYVAERDFVEFDDLAIKTMYLIDRLLQSLERKREDSHRERCGRKKSRSRREPPCRSL